MNVSKRSNKTEFEKTFWLPCVNRIACHFIAQFTRKEQSAYTMCKKSTQSSRSDPRIKFYSDAISMSLAAVAFAVYYMACLSGQCAMCVCVCIFTCARARVSTYQKSNRLFSSRIHLIFTHFLLIIRRAFFSFVFFSLCFLSLVCSFLYLFIH